MSPKQIFESNKWLLINRYRQECMRIAKEFYDESIFNTSHGTQREWHPWTSFESHLRKRNGEVQGVRLGPLRMCETTTNETQNSYIHVISFFLSRVLPCLVEWENCAAPCTEAMAPAACRKEKAALVTLLRNGSRNGSY